MPIFSSFSLLPAAALVAGALLVWLVRRFLPTRRRTLTVVRSVLPILSVSAALVAVWMLRLPESPIHFVLIFPPALGTDLMWVQLDAWGRLFGLLLLWPVLLVAWSVTANSLTEPEPQGGSPAWTQWLLLLAAAFSALAAADWLTLIAALVLFDLVHLATAIPQAGRGWTFMTNSLGGLAILAAAFMLSLDGHSLALAGDDSLPATAAMLITVAALARLAPYPLHFWLPLSCPTRTGPSSSEIRLPAWRWLMQFSSPVLGFYLLTRLTPLLEGAAPGARLVLIAGIWGCLAMALLAWLSGQHNTWLAIPFIALYEISFALVGWIVAGRWSVGFWASLNLVLGVTALAMLWQWTHTRVQVLGWKDVALSTVAVITLIGLPLTVGLFVRLPLYGALLAGKLTGNLVLILAAESMFAAALLRVWNSLRPERLLEQPQSERRSWSTWGAIALLVAPLLILGVHPPLAAWLAGFPPTGRSPLFLPLWEQPPQGSIGLWAALLLPLVMGYGVYRSEWIWPAEMADVRAQLVSFLRLGWLHRAIDRLLSQLRQTIWAVGTMLHGEGYLAWVALSLLLIFLLVLSR